MGISVRSHLIAGFAVVAVGVIAIPPTIAVPTPTAIASHVGDTGGVRTVPRIELAASVRSLVANPPNPAHFAAAAAAIERLDPAAAAVASARQVAIAAAVPAEVLLQLSAVSGGIDAAYQSIRDLADNAVQLVNNVFQFLPNQFLGSVQIDIILYQNLIRPIADSLVYGLLIPVLNDPQNPASYANGLVTVGQTAVNAALNTGIAEFNFYFGWLIPPLPSLPLAAKALESAAPAAPLETTAELPTAPKQEQPEPTAVNADPHQTPAATEATHQSAEETTSTEPPADDSTGPDTSGTDAGDHEKDVHQTHTEKKAGDKHSEARSPAKSGPATSSVKEKSDTKKSADKKPADKN